MKRDDETTPIVNVLRGPALERFDPKDFVLTSFVIGSPKVAAHKAQLGRQNYCYTTYRRYWVWEGERWRVYVHNECGVSFEVLADSTPDQALEAWEDYKRKMRVTPKRIDAMRKRMEKSRRKAG